MVFVPYRVRLGYIERRFGAMPQHDLALKRSQISQAQRLAVVNMKLTDALFSDSNPVPVKYALSLLNVMSPRVRLPLVELNNASKAEIASVLAQVCEQYSDHVLGHPSTAEPNVHDLIRARAQ
jgi:hypothetical protein